MVQKETLICPHCGGVINDEKPQIVDNVLHYKGHRWMFSPSQAAMLSAYIKAMPRAISDDNMAYIVWQGDNEPATARNILSIGRVRIRKAIKPMGLDIEYSSDGAFRLVFGKATTRSRQALTEGQVQFLLAHPQVPAATLARQMQISNPTVLKYRRIHGQRNDTQRLAKNRKGKGNG